MADNEVAAVFDSSEIEVYDGHIDSALHLENMSGYAYRLGTLPLPDDVFTFTIWAMATNAMALNIDVLGLEQTFNLAANVWTKLVVYNGAPDKDEDGNVVRYVDLSPTYSGAGDNDLYLYKAMLETGNHASDWSPAPEDAAAERLELVNRVAAAEIKIEDDNIISTVTQSDTYRNNVSELRSTISSSVTQLGDSVNIRFNNIDEKYDGTKTFVDKASVYQTFDANGIHLGKEGDPFTMDLSSTELAFNDNGNKVAYINNQTMHITNAEVLSRFVIGKFAFVPTDTGMALIYVGDEG